MCRCHNDLVFQKDSVPLLGGHGGDVHVAVVPIAGDQVKEFFVKVWGEA